MTINGEFRDFEHAGWSEPDRAEQYADLFARITDQAVGATIDAVRVNPGDRVLDLCCGHGPLTTALVNKKANVVAGDISPAFLDLVRKAHPNVETKICDAENLKFEDDSFDAVVSGFGICHLADPEAGLREIARVLRPAGRFAMTVWCGPETSPTFRILMDAIQSHGSLDVGLPAGPDFHLFANPDAVGTHFASAGFANAETHTLDLVWQFTDPDALFQIWSTATLRVAELIRAQTEDARTAIRGAMADAVRSGYRDKGIYRVPQPAMLSVGHIA